MSEFLETPNEPVSIFPSEAEFPAPASLLAATESGLDDAAVVDDLVVTEEDLPPIAKSWAYDFTNGVFITGNNGRGPRETRGLATLAVWIEKCLRTDRGAHPVHPAGYGMIRPFDMIGKPLDQAPLEELEPRIRDALTFHPRISDITDFVVDFDSDNEFVNVNFSVVLDDETSLQVNGLALP